MKLSRLSFGVPVEGLGENFEVLERQYRDPVSLMARKAALVSSWMPGGTCLLDIGCGTGEMIDRGADRYQRVVGLDVDPAAIAWCQRRFQERSQIRIDSHDLHHDLGRKLAEIQPSTVLLTDVLEHFRSAESESVLRAIGDALPAGGVLITTTPNWYDALWRRIAISRHLQSHSSYGWARQVRCAGFHPERVETVGFPLVDTRLLRTHLHLFGMCVAIRAVKTEGR